MTQDFDRHQKLEKLVIGYEFEIFSPYSRPELASLLSHTLNKNVLALETSDPGFPLDQNTFKIEPDFSGGMKMHEFVTAPLLYHEAIHTLLKVYNFIDERCHTTNRCGVHINVSVNDPEKNQEMRSLNIFKFVLGLNENKIYELWPGSYQSKLQKVFKNPISYIYPKNRFLSENINAMTLSNPMDFKIPQTKYHGVNFTKLQQGYLEVRYAGGMNYQKKKKESIELINMIGEHLIDTLANNKIYTQDEIDKLREIISNQKHYLNSVRTYEAFVRNYPDIRLTVDLKSHEQVIKGVYANIRESLCDLLEYTEMKSGDINFDTDRNKLQLRGAKIHSGFVLTNLDFFDCKIESELSECFLYNCKVNGSLIRKSRISSDNEIKYSLLEDCQYDEASSNLIKNSYLKNEGYSQVHGRFVECIINRGIISSNSEVDSKTELVNIGKDASVQK